MDRLKAKLSSVNIHIQWTKNKVCMSHAKTFLGARADSAGPDQTAHPRSLIRAFTVRKQNHWVLQNVSMESKCLK